MSETVRKLRSRRSGKPDESEMLEENELTLKYRREDLFDPHTVLPHPEVNQSIYEAVDRFVQRYRGNSLKVTFMLTAGSSLNPSLEKVFREAYYSHYDDEYQKIQLHMRSLYLRAAVMLLISAALFFSGNVLSGRWTDLQLIGVLLSQLSVFCFWAAGDLLLENNTAVSRRKMILRARGAEIEFM